MKLTRVMGVGVILIACAISAWILSTQRVLAQEEENSIVAGYAKGLRIDYAEAERRLQLQAEMSLVEQKIAGDEAYFASWTQHEPTFGLVVSFAAPDGEERIQKYLEGIEWADLVMVQESDSTRAELQNLREQVVAEAGQTELVFGSGVDYMAGKVTLYTEKVVELREHLNASTQIAPLLDRVEFVQEPAAAPAVYDYPYLLGGHAITTCTSGYPVYRVSDGRRFITTAGHCRDNAQNVQYGGVYSVYLGNVVWQNDPENNIGPFGDDLDFQVHDAAGARAFDLTNRIKTYGGGYLNAVVGTETRNSTLNDYVCKNGKVTGETCGYVDNVDYAPGGVWGTSNNYVRVARPSWWGTANMVCRGDSGSPVYKIWIDGTYALGMVSGGVGDVTCPGPNSTAYFFYSPVDYINWSPYRILTTDYPLYFHQNVWWSPTNCIAYQRPLDASGNPAGAQTSSACQTSIPAGSSGQVRSYTTWVTGNQLHEAIWRGTEGYVRSVPLNADGTVNWTAAPGWSHCCSNAAPPEAQGVYIVGNSYKQNVWWSAFNCIEYSRDLDDNGNPSGVQTQQACQTSLPTGSSGSIETYSAYITGQYLHEALWRGGRGYVRDVPLNATNTDVNWAAAPAWSHCCTATGPEGQDGYVLTHP